MHIKITSAVLIAGKIARKDDVIPVDAQTGRRLVQRGKAIVVAHDDGPQDLVDGDTFDAMKLADLRDIAKQQSLEVPVNAKKAELIALLRAQTDS